MGLGKGCQDHTAQPLKSAAISVVILSEAKDLCIGFPLRNAEILHFAQDDDCFD